MRERVDALARMTAVSRGALADGRSRRWVRRGREGEGPAGADRERRAPADGSLTGPTGGTRAAPG
ncbi:hypothetical protein, partial [Streptomyces vinaceusdrappus]|uniref:hypothetical protein n=1 Tax=Streptomyces vinaceusdrappus TaxID=67376 RepID=UPI001C6FF8EF